MANGYDMYSEDAEVLRFFEKKTKDKSLWCIRKIHHKATLKLLEMKENRKEEDDLMVGVHLYANATAKSVLNYVFRKLGEGSCFAQGTAIPIVIGKSLRFDEVRAVLLTQ